jgi:hypothetical protein
VVEGLGAAAVSDDRGKRQRPATGLLALQPG